jgi:hypothetical protein
VNEQPALVARNADGPRLLLLNRLRLVEDDQDAKALIAHEPMLRARLHIGGASLLELDLFVFDLERAPAFEHDVDLVPFMRLLAIRLGGDENVNADLQTRRLVHDLVATVTCAETLGDVKHIEGVRDRHRHARRNLVDRRRAVTAQSLGGMLGQPELRPVEESHAPEGWIDSRDPVHRDDDHASSEEAAKSDDAGELSIRVTQHEVDESEVAARIYDLIPHAFFKPDSTGQFNSPCSEDFRAGDLALPH